MAQDSPIVRLVRHNVGPRIPGTPDARPRPKIPVSIQNERFGQRFEREFTNILDRQDYDVRLDPSALAPERALVFEVIGGLANFTNTAKRIDLEWLSEQLAELEGVQDYLPGAKASEDEDDEDRDNDEGDAADDDAFVEDLLEDAEETHSTIGRLYVGMPTDATYAKLRSLWNRYKSGQRFPDGHSDWWALFDKLHDLRPWGAQDRVTPELRAYMARRVETTPGQPVQFEIDLWYRGDPEVRSVASALLRSRVEDLGGQVLDEAQLAPVRYHAVLVRLPYEAALALQSLDGELAIADEVMSVRPQSSFDAAPETIIEYDPSIAAPEPAPPNKRPLAALIDGYPVENHALLKDRLDVIELDIEGTDAPVAGRFHGTAMASLILHGDLALKEAAIGRTLKVVPILAPNAHGGESPPAEKLALALQG